MKGIIGMVKCDEEHCVQAFITSDMRTGHADSLQMANDAERLAVEEGWTVDDRGKRRHYCPGHSTERKLEVERRAKAFAPKPAE